MEEKVDQKPGNEIRVGYVGYLGFAGQISWAMILVHLPMLEPVVGGKTFSFAVGIAMGIACNIGRLLVFIYGRKFSFSVRVVSGAILSAVFTLGYFVIYACSGPWIPTPRLSVEEPGFWFGLGLALFGGAGNAQLLSTGYGIASLVSVNKPVANSLFFLGQAAAAAFCWPMKRLVYAATKNTELHLGIVMGITSVISLTLIPLYYKRLRGAIATAPTTETKSVSWSQSLRILRLTMLPNTILWLSFMCSYLVIPGEIMLWQLPSDSNETDLKLYLSLCVYVNLLADAFAKCLCVWFANDTRRLSRVLNHKWTPFVLLVLLIIRCGLMPLFYAPPNPEWARYLMLSFFGFIHGIIVSIALSMSSSRVSSADSDLAGYLSSFMIINGLLVGSGIGMIVRLVHSQ